MGRTTKAVDESAAIAMAGVGVGDDGAAGVWTVEVDTLRRLLHAHHGGYGGHRFFTASSRALHCVARAAHVGGGRGVPPAGSAGRQRATRAVAAACREVLKEMATTRTHRLCAVLLCTLCTLHHLLAPAPDATAPRRRAEAEAVAAAEEPVAAAAAAAQPSVAAPRAQVKAAPAAAEAAAGRSTAPPAPHTSHTNSKNSENNSAKGGKGEQGAGKGKGKGKGKKGKGGSKPKPPSALRTGLSMLGSL